MKLKWIYFNDDLIPRLAAGPEKEGFPKVHTQLLHYKEVQSQYLIQFNKSINVNIDINVNIPQLIHMTGRNIIYIYYPEKGSKTK